MAYGMYIAKRQRISNNMALAHHGGVSAASSQYHDAQRKQSWWQRGEIKWRITNT